MPESPRQPALFARLLGASFAALPAPIRAIHQSEQRQVLAGRCRVERGGGVLARLLGACMSLPPAGEHARIEVVIEPRGGGEAWTRRIGGSRMRSSLRAADGLLAESMGPATFLFRLEGDAAAIRWRLCGVRALGVPLPLAWFDVAATESVRDSRYAFHVRAAVAGVGLLAAYDGTLD